MTKTFREYINKSFSWEGPKSLTSTTCKYCGKPVKPTASTCPSCGRAIKRENKVISRAAHRAEHDFD